MGAVRTLQARCVALTVLEQDALLYLASGLLALGTYAMAVSTDYREWAAMSTGPYLLAGACCWLVSRRRAARGKRERRDAHDVLRRGLVLGLLLTTVLIPLSVEIALRAQGSQGAQAQVEIAVIERCGDRVANGHNCYLTHPATVGKSPSSDNPSIDANSYFPYLPGMIVFGLINAVPGPLGLKDARVALSGFALLVVTGALMLVDIPSRRRWRIFQVAIVLPTGALPMVTGGDDLPVIALLLLSIALATRRRPVWSGLAMGVAGTLKFTAWPVLLLMTLGERDRQGRRAILRYWLALLAVVGPVLGLGVGSDVHGFVENVIKFPLGLTGIRSPAASPLIGQELVTLFPAFKPEIVALLALIGGSAVCYALWRWPPDGPTPVARFAGLAMGLAILIAPATRFGYFIYPLNLLTWAYLLKPDADEDPTGEPAGLGGSSSKRTGQDPSGIWKRRSLRTVDGADWSDPASDGEIRGLTDVTSTPTSHS